MCEARLQTRTSCGCAELTSITFETFDCRTKGLDVFLESSHPTLIRYYCQSRSIEHLRLLTSDSICNLDRSCVYRSFHSSCNLYSSSALQGDVPFPFSVVMYASGKTFDILTSSSGMLPPSGQRLRKAAMNGLCVKPRRRSHSTRQVEFPVIRRLDLLKASKTSVPSRSASNYQCMFKQICIGPFYAK